MNNDALVAALGVDAVAAVRGYRLQVTSEAARRGLLMVAVSPSELVPASPDAHVVPLDGGADGAAGQEPVASPSRLSSMRSACQGDSPKERDTCVHDDRLGDRRLILSG
jgi:hypothetical protein